MVRRMVILGVLASCLWVYPEIAQAVTPKPATPRRVARVNAANGRIRAQGPTAALPDTAYYEVVEWSAGGQITEGDRTGPGSIALDATYSRCVSGANCYAAATVQSESMILSTFTSSQAGPTTVSHPITVIWHPGKEKKPEPEKGLTIHFHHFSRSLAFVTGIGIKGFIGSARAKSKAETQGPGGETKSVSENSTSLGSDTELDAQAKTFSVTGLHTGWKGYLSVTVTASSSSVLVGSAEAEAEAEITWEAEVSR